MKKLAIYRNKEFSGILIEESRGNYVFEYDDAYFLDSSKPAISLTLPKPQQK